MLPVKGWKKRKREEEGSSSKGAPPRGGSGRPAVKEKLFGRRYPFETRLTAVRLHLEEGYTLGMVSEELGASTDTIWKWVHRYKTEGRAGLEDRPCWPGSRKARPPTPIHEQIVRVKQEHPGFGIRRIAQWLRRVLLIPASPETVRQTLHRHSMLPKTQPRKAPQGPGSDHRFV